MTSGCTSESASVSGDRALTRSGSDDLLDSHYDHLHHLMMGRILPSAIIVKIVVLAIAADWNTMMAQVPSASNEWYLLNCLNIAYTICYAARDEIASCLDPNTLIAVEAGLVPVMTGTTDGQVDINLSTNITAAFRRMLPALRIISKWVKGNVSRLARVQQAGGVQQEEVERFAETYSDLLRHMGVLFPLEQLPKLYDPLEEDHDMKGFSPLKRGMMDKGESDGPAGDARLEVHPNEEQLMRISDILLDGKLVLFQAEVSPVPIDGRRALIPSLGETTLRLCRCRAGGNGNCRPACQSATASGAGFRSPQQRRSRFRSGFCEHRHRRRSCQYGHAGDDG